MDEEESAPPIRPEPIKVAVVGLGIGRMHVLAFKDVRQHYRVTAVCDVDGERAAEVAGWLRGVRPVTDLAELLADDEVDVIDLCTPPHLHREQVEAVLRSGHDAFCEKPLSGSVADVDEIASIARETGRTVLPILQYRFGHGIQKLRRVVDLGLAGRPYVANVDMAWLRGADYYAVPWRGRWATELGGSLVSHAVHALDMLLLVLGPPSSVFARTATLVNDVEVEDCAAITFTFPSGALAVMSVTLGSQTEISRHRFTFEHLSAESGVEPYTNGQEPWVFTAASGDAGERVTEALAQPVGHPEDYAGIFERYAIARATGGPPPVTLAEVRTLLEVVTAVYASARSGREVELPLPSDHPLLSGWAP
jgi:predicted dehydrogenase